jgi:hypothetical protein
MATESQAEIALELLVDEVDLGHCEPLLARLAATGITFVTLADEARSQDDWLAKFCDLDNATRANDPQAHGPLTRCESD